MAQVKIRLIELMVDGTDRSADVSSAIISSAEADGGFQSFAAIRAGGARDYTLKLTLAEDHSATSLYSKIYDSPGTTVSGTYVPYGSAANDVTYTFDAIIMEPDGDYMGAEATKSPGAVPTVDVEWPLTGKPVKVTPI